ncbi:hypothetical protein HII31_05946 [Pseudocercospora fuligena]|uniref:Uncharacterized protein n=1 Tax=Pseudocercospora fuligena TaxID=685502 RepID=A0A8H6RJ01_9PEZI|nr:hypothetical protein HII31_05946 [Pseudocercospora fuligena]
MEIAATEPLPAMARAEVIAGPQAHDQEACPLFALPGEIRTYIYELVLLAGVLRDNGGLVKLEKRTQIGMLIQPPSVLSLLATCRIIQYEAAGIFYEKIHLEFTCSTKASIERDREFFKTLSQPRLDGISVLSITKRRINNIAWLCKQLKQLSSLKDLNFTITEHESDTWFDLHRKTMGNRIGLLRALARMDQLETVSFSFQRGIDVSSAETEQIADFVGELNEVIPRNWNAAHPQNCVPGALKHQEVTGEKYGKQELSSVNAATTTGI